MLSATMAFVALDHHTNSGGLVRKALQIAREHSYTDVFDVFVSPAAAIVLWVALVIWAITSGIKFLWGKIKSK